jgi:hypothetical protein
MSFLVWVLSHAPFKSGSPTAVMLLPVGHWLVVVQETGAAARTNT